ncbi:MAG: glycosyltransferase family 4 protein [Pyrinomonadaceae bacterium]
MNRKEERLRVLFLAPLHPRVGGVAEVSQSLLDSDLQNEFDIEAINLSKSGNERERTFTVNAASFSFAVCAWVRLVTRLAVFRPNVLYVASSYDWSYLRNVVLMFTAKLFGAKVVCHFHGRRSGALFLPSYRGARCLGRFTSKSFDRIIFLSPGLKESLLPVFGAEKAEVVPNFVEPGHYQLSSGLTAREARAIFVGRLSDDKGIYEFLESMALLRREGRPLRVDILGVAETDEDELSVREFAAGAGIAQALVFHGLKTGQEKADLLGQATVFVLPSKLEIFPLTVLEAYASGLPVVASCVGALPEIIQEGENGFLVRPGNASELAECLRRILDDEQLRLKMAAVNRQTVETLYSKNLSVSKVAEIFRSLR